MFSTKTLYHRLLCLRDNFAHLHASRVDPHFLANLKALAQPQLTPFFEA